VVGLIGVCLHSEPSLPAVGELLEVPGDGALLDDPVQTVERLRLRLGEEALQREPGLTTQGRSDLQHDLRGRRITVLVTSLTRLPVEVDDALVARMRACHPRRTAVDTA
jgi:hypothetical protein